ncbi:MAG: SMC-Scp complex subunit ScpB [Alphaproteobacteria bacterium]|nr:SMC-Scp complex subunit ScpB [Alphaproteobacteria bacterium]
MQDDMQDEMLGETQNKTPQKKIMQDVAAGAAGDPAAAPDATASAPDKDSAEGQARDKLADAIRIAEALVFAAEKPIEESDIAKRMPDGVKVTDVMAALRAHYEGRGVNLVRVARKWTFRTATDLGWLLSREMEQQKKLSRAALETLAIIAYHQPVTRAEIEEIRGVAISKGTLDVLIETGWCRLRGRRKAPGRPVTYGTTDDFLLHFGLEQITDLPGLDELKGAGLFDGRLPQGFGVPTPNDSADLTEDEEPLEEADLLALAQTGEIPGEGAADPAGTGEENFEELPGQEDGQEDGQMAGEAAGEAAGDPGFPESAADGKS